MTRAETAFGIDRPMAMTAAERCARNREKMRQARQKAKQFTKTETWAARDPDVRRCRQESKQSAKRVARAHAWVMADAIAAMQRADELSHARARGGRPRKERAIG